MSLFSNRKQLNFRSKLTKGFYVRIIESPRLWMSKNEIESLVADIKTVAVSAKLQDLDKQILKNKQGYIHYYEAYNKMVNNIPSKFAAKMFGYKKIA